MLAGLDAAAGSGALAIAHVALQGAESADPGSVHPITRTAVTIGSMLVVGAILIGAAPVYVNRVLRDVRDEPLGSFAWGIVTLVVGSFLVWALAVTVVGLFLAIPLFVVLFVLGLAGNVLAYLAVLEDVADSRWQALGVATLAVFLVSLLSTIGTIVNAVVGAVGMGAMVRRWME